MRGLDTACTKISVDADRVILSEGILSKELSSMELYQVQSVNAVQKWWQRLFDIGTVILNTSDAAHPVWRLYGMKQVEQLRQQVEAAAKTARDKNGVREVQIH
jgi:uncharacterized membrane protein YdbT with pleckstrin-like domain